MKMKTLSLLPLLLLSLISTSCWSMNSNDLVKRDGLYYKKSSDIPFTGEVSGGEQDEIEWITAQTPYVALQVNGKSLLHQISLTKILTQLNQKYFVRIHRSAIVNLRYIKSLNSRSNGDYDLLLFDGSTLRLSRNYRDQLLLKLNQLS